MMSESDKCILSEDEQSDGKYHAISYLLLQMQLISYSLKSQASISIGHVNPYLNFNIGIANFVY